MRSKPDRESRVNVRPIVMYICICIVVLLSHRSIAFSTLLGLAHIKTFHDIIDDSNEIKRSRGAENLGAKCACLEIKGRTPN